MRRVAKTICLFLLFVFVRTGAFCQQETPLADIEKARNFVNKKIPDSAIFYANLALQEATNKKDTPLHIRALGIKGKGFFYQNKSGEAVALYFAGLKLAKQPRDNKQMAYLYGEIGWVYYNQGHYKEAKEYYYKSLDIRKQTHEDQEVANALINISSMCRDHKEYAEAFAALGEVKELLPGLKDKATEGYYYTNVGVLHEFTRHLDSAAYYYHKAYDVWKQLGDESEIYRITFNIGYLADERGNHQEALDYYNLAKASALKFGSGRDVAHVYGTMAEAYAGTGNYKSAYEYLHKYADMSDSLGKDEFNAHVALLDKQFQTEKNKQTIQEQDLELKTASLAIQKQRSATLLIMLVLIAVLSAGVITFIYRTFRSRLNKRVEEAKGRFFANVVHEIRTPLSMIQAPLKVLQEKVTDKSMQQQLDIAERNTRRLNELINQMLDISKLDASVYKLNESAGNLSDFVQDIAKQYEIAAGAKNISFTKQIDANAENVLFDKDAMEKVISNLLDNAIKYTPQNGAVGIDLSIGHNPKTMKLNVWDTGPGIAKEDHPKVFSRFYRAREHEKAGIKGIGIGLAMVKEIIAIMNGSISVESEPGKGAVFTVSLPLKELPRPHEAITQPGNAENTILLVEDDKDILDFNKTLLTEKGFHILTAANGIEASAILTETLPDLVITDMMMPVKDGMALLKEIRANMATSHMPVIILSAKASAQSKIEGIEEGAQAYLPKPFLPAELVALVKSQLAILEKQKEHYLQKSSEQEQSIEERFSGDSPFTRKCYSMIYEHLDDAQLSVEKLAELMNINRSHFQRKIKTLTGYSPSELIKTIRLEKAREMLLKEEGNITEVAYATGFTSQSYFTKCFSEHFGFPPSHLRERTAK